MLMVDEDKLGATVLEDVGDFGSGQTEVDGANDRSCSYDALVGICKDRGGQSLVICIVIM